MKKDNKSKKFELMAIHIKMFKDAFAGYIKNYESPNLKVSAKEDIEEIYENKNGLINLTGNINDKDADSFMNKSADVGNEESAGIIFEEIICNYYQTVISALKKLTKYDKKYLKILIDTYEELWKSAPKLKNKDYLSPYLSDLCRFLHEIRETGALTYFYNLLIYCREIPFLLLHSEQEKQLENLYLENEEQDPFLDFRKERKERLINDFDGELFNKAYDKFFLILSGWHEKAEGYYTKDEIYFMNGLFILDELIGRIYFEEESGEIVSNIQKIKPEKSEKYYGSENHELNNRGNINKDGGTDNRIFQKVAGINEDKNVYRYIYDDGVKEKISLLYEKALENFNQAINYNPNNPRYYYEYGRCLKNSGKSKEAEIFFKKAFDLDE